MRLAAITICLAASCAESDPSFGDPNGIAGKKLPGESSSSGAPAPTGTTATDAGGGGGDPPPTAPTKTLKASHAAAIAAGKTAPADATTIKSCLECHGDGAAGTPPKFAFGGYVAESGAGASGVTITVTGLPPVLTDADGYFWSKAGEVAAASNAQAQKGATPQKMGGALAAKTGGGCGAAACHAAAPDGIGPIHP